MNCARRFVQIDQNKWVHLDTIRVIEFIEENYYMWIVNQEGQCLKFQVQPEYTDVKALLETMSFQLSKVPNLLD